MNQKNELPKGMEVIEVEELKQIEPYMLGRSNYIAAIYQALQSIPFDIRIAECRIVERDGAIPEVSLVLNILGEKGVEISEISN